MKTLDPRSEERIIDLELKCRTLADSVLNLCSTLEALVFKVEDLDRLGYYGDLHNQINAAREYL